MELKVVFSMDKKTIDCIDRLAGALAGIKNLGEVNVPLVTQEKTDISKELVPDNADIPKTDISKELVPDNADIPKTDAQEDTGAKEETAQPQPETAARVYTRDELSKASAEFARLGADKREQLQKLVSEKYGVVGLMNIPEERYGEFAADLREMGANI